MEADISRGKNNWQIVGRSVLHRARERERKEEQEEEKKRKREAQPCVADRSRNLRVWRTALLLPSLQRSPPSLLSLSLPLSFSFLLVHSLFTFFETNNRAIPILQSWELEEAKGMWRHSPKASCALNDRSVKWDGILFFRSFYHFFNICLRLSVFSFPSYRKIQFCPETFPYVTEHHE